MRGCYAKKLVIKLKTGEVKEYLWNEVDFVLHEELFVVRDTKSGDLLLGVPISNVCYYEMEVTHGN